MTQGTTGLKPLIGRYCQVVSLCVVMLLHVHEGKAEERYALQIPPAQADVALKQLSRQSGYPVIFRTNEVVTVHTKAVAGQYTVQQALDTMFEGTYLVGGLSLEEVVTVSFRDIEQPTVSFREIEQPTDQAESTMENKKSIRKHGIFAVFLVKY